MLRTHNIAWHKFCSLFLNINKREKRVETPICPNSSFSHKFCQIVWKNLKNLSEVFYTWLFWITLMSSNYPLRHYDRSLTIFEAQTSSLNISVGEVKSFFFRFFSRKTKILALQRIFHKTRHCTWDCCIMNIICVIRRRYPETKNCPNTSFSNNFCHWNLNNKETILFCF